MTVSIHTGDCREVLRELADESVHCVVTSPPYWGLRDYGHNDQLGIEHTPGEYCDKMVEVFREVRRVLRRDGTIWLNLGDTYIGGRSGGVGTGSVTSDRNHKAARNAWLKLGGRKHREAPGLKPKDLVGIPWRVAFALQDDGWWLRSDIIWHKPSPMPETVKDRPTRAHEYLFLLSRSRRYQYDAAAIAEPVTGGAHPRGKGINPKAAAERSANDASRAFNRRRKTTPRPRQNASFSAAVTGLVETRNRRTVWTVPQEPYRGAHTSTFPTALVKPCILAGCPAGGTVLDPFAGAGTTGLVADRLGRDAILIELNGEYADAARCRIDNDAPLLAFGNHGNG